MTLKRVWGIIKYMGGKMRNLAILGIILGIMSILVLSGCQTTPEDTGLTGKIILEEDDFIFLNETNKTMEEIDDAMEELDEVIEEPIAQDVAYTMQVVEGELVSLDLEAVDPDGDLLTYTFSEPLNAQGRWQTEIGDEGRYLVTVTASDGRLSTSEDILVVVDRANRPPIMECPETLSVDEGDSMMIDCNIYDEEGDNILISYEGWSTSSSKTTTYEDQGEYTVLVRASDGTSASTTKVTVTVNDVNRPPVIETIDDITLMETNTVTVVPIITDPDGDEVSVSFSNPLDNDGEWRTNDGDAGTYEVTMTANDGTNTVTESFSVTVTQINTAPVLKPIADFEVDEGELIMLPVNAYDPEGDQLFITYSGYMESEEYQTTYDDAGIYEQTVAVSDGVLTTSETFTITIVDQNRPPQFVFPGG